MCLWHITIVHINKAHLFTLSLIAINMSSSAALQVESRSIGSGPLRVLDGDAMLPVRALRTDAVTCADLHNTNHVVLTPEQGNTTFYIAKRAGYSGNARIDLPSSSDMVGLTFRFQLSATFSAGYIQIWNESAGIDFTSGLIAQTTPSSVSTTDCYSEVESTAHVGDWVEFYGLAPGYICVRGFSAANQGIRVLQD